MGRGMMRKGLAPVLSIAFITLGTLIAVALLWTFTRQTASGEEVIDPSCLTTSLDVLSCQTYSSCLYVGGHNIFTADLLVKRGTGKADLTGLRFSFEDWLGRKRIHDVSLIDLFPGYTLQELQTLRFQYPARIPTPVADPLVRVIPLIGPDSTVCPFASAALQCSSSSYSLPLPLGSIAGINDVEGQCCQCPKNFSECYDPGPLGTGSDPYYPIINGVVHYTADPSDPSITPSPLNSPPPGYVSVCCDTVPAAYADLTLGGITFPPLGSPCPVVT